MKRRPTISFPVSHLRRTTPTALILTALLLLSTALPHTPTPPVTAQETLQGRATYALVLYSGPDTAEAIIGVLAPGSTIILEARSADGRWVLGHAANGPERGWISARFVETTTNTTLSRLSVSHETIFAALPAADHSSNYQTINLGAYPAVPQDFGQARDIFARGQAEGRSPIAISKIGDCISDNQHFLSPFGWDEYNLGLYTELQPLIDAFSKTLAQDSLAAYDGLVTTAVLDPDFANPLACEPGESPLRCEYRVRQSSVAIIMFGAQDLLFTPPDQFDRNLRQIVHETIQAGVIPILSTFPANLNMWDESLQYNRIVIQIALDYDIPLMNLWAALETIPNHGLDHDGRHLSPPLTHSGDLTGKNLYRGYPLRNLVTLQTLDAVWRSTMQ